MAEGGTVSCPMPLKVFCERKTTIYLDWRSPKVVLRGKNLVIGENADSESIFPLEDIRRLVLVGKVNISSLIFYNLLRCNIPVDWLDVLGRPLGRMHSFNEETHFFMRSQCEFAENPKAFELAKNLLLAKVDNCHEVVRRRVVMPENWHRERAGLCGAASPQSLRGHEGACARIYFSCWDGHLHKFQWRGRHAHPPPDPVNMMLSLGYSLLHNRLASALDNAGLNPRIGFFHETRGAHAALASDLVEPLRAFVDASVLSLIRKEEIAPIDFKIRAGSCVCGAKGAFSKILAAFEEMFETEHPFYIDPENREMKMALSINSLLDDLAASFASFISGSGRCILPRLTPCPLT